MLLFWCHQSFHYLEGYLTELRKNLRGDCIFDFSDKYTTPLAQKNEMIALVNIIEIINLFPENGIDNLK